MYAETEAEQVTKWARSMGHDLFLGLESYAEEPRAVEVQPVRCQTCAFFRPGDCMPTDPVLCLDRGRPFCRICFTSILHPCRWLRTVDVKWKECGAHELKIVSEDFATAKELAIR